MSYLIIKVDENKRSKSYVLRDKKRHYTLSNSKSSDIYSEINERWCFYFEDNNWIALDLNNPQNSWKAIQKEFKPNNKLTIKHNQRALLFSSAELQSSEHSPKNTWRMVIERVGGIIAESRLLAPNESFHAQPNQNFLSYAVTEPAQAKSQTLKKQKVNLTIVGAGVLIVIAAFTSLNREMSESKQLQAPVQTLVLDKSMIRTKPIETKSASSTQHSTGSRSPASESKTMGHVTQILSRVMGRSTKLLGVDKAVLTNTQFSLSSSNSSQMFAEAAGALKAGSSGSSAGTGTSVHLSGNGLGSAGISTNESESVVTGGLERDVIAQVIKSQVGEILYCYERQLSATPELSGKISVRFTISPSGSIESRSINTSTLNNSNVENCILKKMDAWKFPYPKGGTRVVVTYPFLFRSTN